MSNTKKGVIAIVVALVSVVILYNVLQPEELDTTKENVRLQQENVRLEQELEQKNVELETALKKVTEYETRTRASDPPTSVSWNDLSEANKAVGDRRSGRPAPEEPIKQPDPQPEELVIAPQSNMV